MMQALQTVRAENRASPALARSFRPDVQGLRAIAVLAVILYHFGISPIRGGFVGVDVFFVISGFVITQMLIRERSARGGNSLVGFYARRVRRILPAAGLVLITTVVATQIMFGNPTSTQVGHDALSAAFFVANLHFANSAQSYLAAQAPPSPLLHFWSLSIEEQFYFVWPTLFIAIGAGADLVHRRKRIALALIAICIAAFIYASFLTQSNPQYAYYSALARSGELALGALVAVGLPWLNRIPNLAATAMTWIGFAAVLLSTVIIDNRTPFPGTAVLLPTVATAMVIAASPVRRSWSSEILLGSRLLVWIGGLSYSLYLWHWPIYALAYDHWGHVPSLETRAALLVLTLLVSFASYRILEHPIRQSSLLRKLPWLSIGMGAGIIGIVVGVSLLVPEAAGATPAWSGKLPPITSQSQLNTLLAQGSSLRTLPPLVVPLDQLSTEFPTDNTKCKVPFNAPTATVPLPPLRKCTWGDVTARKLVVLFGDSHSTMWIPTFNLLGKEYHFRVVLIARSSCYVADMPLWSTQLNRPGTACFGFHLWAIHRIDELHPSVVVVSDDHGGSVYDASDNLIPAPAYAAAMTRTFDELRASGRIVIELQTTPHPVESPTLCIPSNASDLRGCNFSRIRAESELDPLDSTAAAAGGAFFIPTLQWFCTNSECPVVANHTIMYVDQGHASEHFLLELSQLLQQRLSRWGV